MLIGINDIEESLYHMRMKKKQMCLDRLIDICKDVMKIDVKAQKTLFGNARSRQNQKYSNDCKTIGWYCLYYVQRTIWIA